LSINTAQHCSVSARRRLKAAWKYNIVIKILNWSLKIKDYLLSCTVVETETQTHRDRRHITIYQATTRQSKRANETQSRRHGKAKRQHGMNKEVTLEIITSKQRRITSTHRQQGLMPGCLISPTCTAKPTARVIAKANFDPHGVSKTLKRFQWNLEYITTSQIHMALWQPGWSGRTRDLSPVGFLA